MPASAQLCSTCNASFSAIRTSTDVLIKDALEYHGSFDALQKIAETCAVCRRIAAVLEPQDMTDSARETSIHFYLQGGVRALTVCLPDFSKDIRRKMFRYLLQPVEPATDRSNIPGYSAQSDTGSDSCLAIARFWYQKCLSEHKSCERPRRTVQQKAWRPTRLLLIKPDDGITRLVEGDDMPSNVQYATLSYRWGQVPTKDLLTKALVDEWKEKGLPSVSAMKSISESLLVARSLGFSYIWIDSLCIIQDSADDWRREVSLMSDVYKYSSLNIAATSARDSSEGLFRDRDVSLALPTRLQFDRSDVTVQKAPKPSHPTTTTTTTTTTTQYPEMITSPDQLHGSYELRSDLAWFDNIERSLLNGRGWVLQEKLLSPRILNFTESQLFWECNELPASESWPYGPNPSSSVRDAGDFRTDDLFDVPHDASAQDASKDTKSDTNLSHVKYRALTAWFDQVRAYTRRDPVSREENLSVASDKLVAISAIAREFKPHLDSQYLAGLWKVRLAIQLDWRVLGRSERPSVYRAPSWSWASVSGEIAFPSLYWGFRGCQSYIEIVETQVDLAGTDEMGQVKSGHLWLRGQLLALDIQRIEVAETHDSLFENKRHIELSHNSQTIGLTALMDYSVTSLKVPCRLFCLPLISTFHGAYHLFSALLLESAETERTFRRVGHIEKLFSMASDFKDFPIIRAVGTFDPNKPKSERITQNKDNMVVFKLI